MFEIRIEGEFAAAHHLADFHGKCENLHGHNYRVRVWARGGTLDPGGMLVDFGVLKAALAETLAGLDHSDLNAVPEFGDNPSAERIARYIFDGMKKRLPLAPISRVDAFETRVNMASYFPD
jgi:6-pyruvoyltetrahydropterin/6-carboxytetrahydropterin synthase